MDGLGEHESLLGAGKTTRAKPFNWQWFIYRTASNVKTTIFITVGLCSLALLIFVMGMLFLILLARNARPNSFIRDYLDVQTLTRTLIYVLETLYRAWIAIGLPESLDKLREQLRGDVATTAAAPVL